MEDFESLTDSQLEALTDQQVSNYIDLLCAERGIPLSVPNPGRPPKSIDPGPRETVYMLPTLYFTSRAQAEQVLKLALASDRVGLDYVPNTGYKHKFMVAADEDPNLGEVKCFESAMSATVSKSLSAHERAVEEHGAAAATYERHLVQLEAVRSEVHERIREASLKTLKQRQMRKVFDRYLELAGGRRDVAANFLAAAHQDARETCPDLFELPDPPGLGQPRAYHDDSVTL